MRASQILDPEFLRNHSARPEDFFLTRRQFLNRFGMGFGALSLASLLGDRLGISTAAAAEPGLPASTNPLAPRKPHFPAKAKHVVHVFAQGAPSQVDTWDPKPALARYDGQPIPGANGVGYASPFKFSKHGKAGIEVSEVFSKLAAHVDDMAIIRSCYTDIPAHDVATIFMNTGSLRQARPSVGSWMLYGLGTENQNMPGFISLRPGNVPREPPLFERIYERARLDPGRISRPESQPCVLQQAPGVAFAAVADMPFGDRTIHLDPAKLQRQMIRRGCEHERLAIQFNLDARLTHRIAHRVP